MAELHVKTITNSNVLPTDKLYVFNNEESKAGTIKDIVQSIPGTIPFIDCYSLANSDEKIITVPNFTERAGESFYVKFSFKNAASSPCII